MSNVKSIDDYLFRPSPDYRKPDYLSDLIEKALANWEEEKRFRQEFAIECVRHRMETTDSASVLANCKRWMGERS